MPQKRKYSLDNTDKETLQKWYYLMTLGRQLDNKAPNYLKQALGWSYHAPYAGHDGIQLAIGQFFDKEVDFLFPYYRDMLTAISAGLTPANHFTPGVDILSPYTRLSAHVIFVHLLNLSF
jgi:2-oxoisovalerate dehydrogenase E1 component